MQNARGLLLVDLEREEDVGGRDRVSPDRWGGGVREERVVDQVEGPRLLIGGQFPTGRQIGLYVVRGVVRNEGAVHVIVHDVFVQERDRHRVVRDNVHIHEPDAQDQERGSCGLGGD